MNLAKQCSVLRSPDIIEVLDHHRLGGSLKSSQPIRFINEPVGSTCTLVARQFRAAGITPTPGIALCMPLASSQTRFFLRSPTATEVDRNILGWLRDLCEVDLETFAKEFFDVGSALRTCTPDEVVREDCKEFVERGHRFSISQIEEIGFELFWTRHQDLQEALVRLTRERNSRFLSAVGNRYRLQRQSVVMSSEPDFWGRDQLSASRALLVSARWCCQSQEATAALIALAFGKRAAASQFPSDG